MNINKKYNYTPFSLDEDSILWSLSRLFNPYESGSSNSFGRECTYSYELTISEENKQYQTEMILPGVKKKDLMLTVEDQTVHIRKGSLGKNEKISQEKDSFHKTIEFPDDADLDKISAKLADGILELIIPKKEKPKATSIKIT